jgi:8-oxo-dGTP diphosphatase
VPADSVGEKELHPAFATAWPELWRRLLQHRH